MITEANTNTQSLSEAELAAAIDRAHQMRAEAFRSGFSTFFSLFKVSLPKSGFFMMHGRI